MGLLQESCTSDPSSSMLTPSSLVTLLLLCLSHISGGMNVIQGHNMGGLSGSYSFLDLYTKIVFMFRLHRRYLFFISNFYITT